MKIESKFNKIIVKLICKYKLSLVKLVFRINKNICY